MKNKNNQRETDADGGTYWYLWLILTNCVKGWERLTYNRLRSCKKNFQKRRVISKSATFAVGDIERHQSYDTGEHTAILV